MRRASDYPIIVIGGSAGGLESLCALLGQVPIDLRAAMFVVIHFPPRATSYLPAILTREQSLPATHALDGEAIAPAHIYVAPPDRHLLVERGHLRLSSAPPVNHFRPAIDPLFSSAAAAYGARVVGVLLSGHDRDGVDGLRHISAAGGCVIVQDPGEAQVGSMPRAALAAMRVDHCRTANGIARRLVELARARPRARA